MEVPKSGRKKGGLWDGEVSDSLKTERGGGKTDTKSGKRATAPPTNRRTKRESLKYALFN